jgi:tetratricopeptide (TPR) repeat protein
VIYVWFSLFHTVPWIMINAESQRSLDRYLLIQENDPHPVDETGYNLYKVARILQGAGLEDELQGLFSRAVERNPGDTISYYNLANWHHRRKEHDRAAVILNTLLRMTTAYPKAHWLMGSIHIGKGEFGQALPYMEKASPHFQQRVDFLHQLWSVYHSTGQYQQALACAERMIELEPENTNAHHLLALASIGLGDYRTAKQAWEQILIINPNDSRAIKSLRSLEDPEE